MLNEKQIKGEIVMSAASLERLPGLFAEIVRQQRAIDKVWASKTINWLLGSNMVKRKAELRRAAELYCWGDSKKKGNKA